MNTIIKNDGPPIFDYVDITSPGCEGWLNLFFGDYPVALVDDVDIAGELRKVLSPKDLSGVATITVPRDLLYGLLDDDDCSYDHHGGCQAHGYLSLEKGQRCPQAEARALLSGVPATDVGTLAVSPEPQLSRTHWPAPPIPAVRSEGFLPSSAALQSALIESCRRAHDQISSFSMCASFTAKKKIWLGVWYKPWTWLRTGWKLLEPVTIESIDLFREDKGDK